jgi:hypothetical protein
MVNPNLSVSSNGTVKYNVPLETSDGNNGVSWKAFLFLLLCLLLSCLPKCATSWYDAKKKKELELEKVKCEEEKAKIRVNEYREKMEIRKEFKDPKNGEDGKGGSPSDSADPLKSESLNDTLNKPGQPRPKIMGGLITQGEIAVIFAPPGQGKSFLTMQAGIEAAEGSPSSLVDKDDTAHKAQNVIIYDVEMSDEDIRRRYSGYTFPDNLQRVASCTFADSGELIHDIEPRLKGQKGDVTIIIDNITTIMPTLGGESVRVFINEIKRLQAEYNTDSRALTFIVVCHTQKEVDLSNLPSNSSMSGSANIGNFADCVYALWPTNLGDKYKMLCTLKFRKGERNEQAILLRREQKPYLHFVYEKECPGEELLLNDKAKNDAHKPDNDGGKDSKTSTLAGNGQVTTEQVVEKWIEFKTKKDDDDLVGLTDPQMRRVVASALGVKNARTIDRHLADKTLKMHEEGKTDNDIAKELYLEDDSVQRYLKEPADKAA